jgi:oligoendopeptidase F
MGVPRREELGSQDCWDLSLLYAESSTWDSEFAVAEENLSSVSTFAGRLSSSSDVLAEGLNTYLGVRQLIEKLYTYAHLKSDEDTSNPDNLGRLQRAINLYARLSSTASFIAPELLDIDPSTLETYLQEPALKDLKRLVREIVRYRPHTLSPSEEALLAQGLEVFASCSQVFSQLNNADLEFGSVEVDGNQIPLTHSTYTLLLKNPNPEVRRQTFEQYYGVFDAHKNTISAAFAGSLKKDVFLSRARKHASCLNQGMFGDNVEVEVYHNLLESVSTQLDQLHRYYKLRKELLKLDSQHIYDTYTPLVSQVRTNYSFDEAAEIILCALNPLGDEYVSTLRKGLTEDRWVDRYENVGKRSGGYSSGCYDSMPYILMNYKAESLNDMYTLAHEAGHSMHSYLSRSNQLYQNSEYTIFVAEVASTFNEQLLVRELRKRNEKDENLTAYLINHQIDDIKGTFFRQIMFAEFEKIVHDMAEKNMPLTVDSFRRSYRELLAKYFGEAVDLHELDCLECLRIPHFYSPFYVYKYATGLAAAVQLSDMVLNGGTEEQSRYLSFLKGGCSKYPLELLQDAGVDLTTSAPTEATVGLFSSLLDELENVLSA